MRIGFDIGPIRAGRTGVGTYSYHLLKYLLKISPDDSFLGFSTGMSRPDLGDMEDSLQSLHISLPTRLMYKIWEFTGIPKVDSLLKDLDLYHATNFFLPPTRKAKRVVTIHDLAFISMPELCSPKIVAPFRKCVQRVATDADAVIACSESTKDDIINLLHIDPSRITVALEAVDENFKAIEPYNADKIIAGYGIKTPFILFVGTLEPRKNIPTLLRAFAKVMSDIPHNLVLIGSVGWMPGEIFETIDELGISDRVVRPGYVKYCDLPAFYTAADVFVFPSLCEGFGLPVLEAMTCGCPVITSNNSSLPEVAGDAGICLDAKDVDAFAQAIRSIVDDKSLHASMIAHGRDHAKKFSWETCAHTTLDVYRRLIQ